MADVVQSHLIKLCIARGFRHARRLQRAVSSNDNAPPLLAISSCGFWIFCAKPLKLSLPRHCRHHNLSGGGFSGIATGNDSFLPILIRISSCLRLGVWPCHFGPRRGAQG